MGCPCKDKKKRLAAKQQQETVEYKSSANGEAVELGLSQFFRLPMRIPEAIDGKDLVIYANKLQMQKHRVPGAVTIIGRNAKIDPRHKKQLMERWPNAFDG